MTDAIFSIHPNFAEAMYKGWKKAELRSVRPTKPIDRIWIYETAPVQKITGYFYEARFYNHKMSIKELLVYFFAEELVGLPRREKDHTEKENLVIAYKGLGILSRFKTYYAIPVMEIHKCQTGIELLGTPPQSWKYCTPAEQEYYWLEYLIRIKQEQEKTTCE